MVEIKGGDHLLTVNDAEVDERVEADARLAYLRKHYHGIVRSIVRYQLGEGFVERDQACPF